MSNSLNHDSSMAVVNTETGELMPPAPANLDDIVRRSTGGFAKSIKTSFDVSTQQGKMALAKHLNFQQPENQKQNEGWYGRPFNLVGYTCRGVLSTKNKDGTVRDQGIVLVHTVLEADDGSLVTSASDYVYNSLMEIVSLIGIPSVSKPIKVKIGKAGAADKIFLVFDNASSSPEPMNVDHGRKKK